MYGGPGNDHPQVDRATTACTAMPVTTSWTATRATTTSTPARATTRSPATRATTSSTPATAPTRIYGEEGNNTIIAKNDGVRDDIFCNMIKVATPPGTIIYIGELDPLDALRNCTVVVRRR